MTNSSSAKDFIERHIISGPWSVKKLVAASANPPPTDAGVAVAATMPTDEGEGEGAAVAQINGFEVLMTNVKSTNGLIHVIDGSLS